jgi:hypothetical protein
MPNTSGTDYWIYIRRKILRLHGDGKAKK